MQSILRISFAFAVFGYLASAHPAFHHHFNNIVNANPCLKRCVDDATAVDVELSLVKTANFSDYLLNLGSICGSIATARTCIDSCAVDSNPFALESMNVICSPTSVVDVVALTPCLSQSGNEVGQKCEQECGDYDQVNDLVHELTQQYKPTENNQNTKVQDVMQKRNEACGVLKCSNRCAVKGLTEQCGKLPDDRQAGEVMQSLIERVLEAHRRDLEKMKLIDTMAHSVPPQCTFMYLPESMFNETHDETAMEMHEELRDVSNLPIGDNKPQKPGQNMPVNQFQAYLLKKQIHVLDLQEKNLAQEGRKLDMELELLTKKRSESTNDDGPIKLF